MIRLVVGLGNPGKKYEGTRHNLGREVVAALQKSRVASHESPVECFLPETFMNRSGQAVGERVRFLKLEPEQLLVVHDDLDLELGSLKLQQAGSAAGHHGVESVIEQLGSQDFWRLRLGIGRPESVSRISYLVSREKKDLVTSYVLSRFTTEEQSLKERTVDAAVEFLVALLQTEPDDQTRTIEES